MVTIKEAFAFSFAVRPKGLTYHKRLPSDVGWQGGSNFEAAADRPQHADGSAQVLISAFLVSHVLLLGRKALLTRPWSSWLP